MKFYDSKGLEVDILETDGGFSEAFIYNAQYVESGEEVPEEELDYLTNKYAEYVSFNEHEKLIGTAEAACEGDR